MNCPKCNGQIESGQKFCARCGTDLTMASFDEPNKTDNLRCPKCGCEILADQKFCSLCGLDLTNSAFLGSDAPRLSSQNESNVKPLTPSVTNPMPCPRCGKMTDSLKVYRLPALWISLFIYLRYATEGHVCCPSCMRKQIMLHGFTYNIITANIYWPFLILPWSIVNLCRTYTKGHSKEIVQILQNQQGE